MTQPDGLLPATAWNDGSYGPISWLAARSQQDVENELYGNAASPFDDILGTLFSGLTTGISFTASFLAMVVEEFFGWIPGSGSIVGILDDFADWLANPSDLSNIPILGPLFGGDGSFLSGLIPGLDASKIISGSLDWAITGVQSLLDAIFRGITGSSQTGNLLSDILNALTNIPFLNILGIGGPSNIGSSISTGWNNLISGFLGSPGDETVSLADLFNVPFEVSSRATRGAYAWDLLGQRDNTSLHSGLQATSESTFPLSDAQAAISATQSASPISWQRINRSSPFGVISWRGYGNANMSAFHVNVWKMDITTGDLALIHHSANIIGDISVVDAWHEYSLPVNQELAAVAGEVYGVELVPIGAGTHTVLGKVVTMPDHPTAFPKRLASVRDNSGGPTPPGTVASASVVYANNVPWIEVGIKSGDVSAHTYAPQGWQLVTSETVPIPSWANFVDVVPLGAGGGGHAGGTLGISGEGGDGGHWNSVTWARGTHFSGSGTIITATIGAGGTGGSGSGDNGGATTVSIPGYSITAAGGAGGDALKVLGDDKNGGSPGNMTYNGVPYYGGQEETSYGETGNAPGGGGAGGNWLTFSAGGNGARGVAFVVFRQS